MKRTLLLLTTVLLFNVVVIAQTQNPAATAKPEEQDRLKPLLEAEKKAVETLNAKIATIPEAQAVRDGKTALDKANAAWQKAAEALPQYKAVKDAQAALDKASESFRKATDTTPEGEAWKQAQAALLDAVYQIMASHSLSSREYQPELDKQGQLVFVKRATNSVPKP